MEASMLLNRICTTPSLSQHSASPLFKGKILSSRRDLKLRAVAPLDDASSTSTAGGLPHNSDGPEGSEDMLTANTSVGPDVFSGPFHAMSLEDNVHHPYALQQQRRKEVLTEEEKLAKMEEAKRLIKEDIKRREALARARQVAQGLESELKFARLLAADGQWEQALGHFNKVRTRTAKGVLQNGEAILGAARCLEHLNRLDEARGLFQSLIYHRSPFPHLRRQAELALQGIPVEDDSQSSTKTKDMSVFDDYMTRMSANEYATWYDRTQKKVARREETKLERAFMEITPLSLLLMGPLLLLYLLYTAKLG